MKNRPRLVLVTGVPGCGKTGATARVGSLLGCEWTVVHGDDLIGPSIAIGGDGWSTARPIHPRTIGWSAGWHLSYPRNVLAEGCFRTKQEVSVFLEGVGRLSMDFEPAEVILLDVDLDRTAQRLAEDPLREPTLKGADRLPSMRNWVRAMVVNREIAADVIDCRGKTLDQIAEELFRVIKR